MPQQNQAFEPQDRNADFSKTAFGASYMPTMARPNELTPYERQQIVDRYRVPLSAGLGTYIPIVGNLIGSAIGRGIGNKRADAYLQSVQQQADAQNAQIQQNNAIFQSKQKYLDTVLADQAQVQGRPNYGALPAGMSPEEYRLNVAPTVDAVGEQTLAARKDYLAGQRIQAEQAAAREAGAKRAAIIKAMAQGLKPPTQPQQQVAPPPPQVQPLPQQQIQQPMMEPYAQEYGPNPYEQQPLQGNVSETTVPSANIPYGMDLVDAGYGAFTPKELLDMQQESRMQEQVPVSDYTAGVGARKDLASAANTELDTQLDRRYGPGERSSMINSRNASATASRAAAGASRANATFRNYANSVLSQMNPAQRAMFITREGTVYADPEGNIVPQMETGQLSNGDVVVRGADGKLKKVMPIQLGAPRE